MAKRGRPRLPDEIKIARGTQQHCRVNPAKPEFPVLEKLPPPPRWMSKSGKKIYRTAGALLLQYRILTPLNIPQFVAYCREISIYLDIEADFDTLESRIHSMSDKKGNRYTSARAIHRIAKDALKNAQSLASEFGLTPAAQSRIMAPFMDKPSDEVDNYMNG